MMLSCSGEGAGSSWCQMLSVSIHLLVKFVLVLFAGKLNLLVGLLRS